MAIKNTLEGKMTYRIKRSADAVFLRRDFKDLGGYDQVGRVVFKRVGFFKDLCKSPARPIVHVPFPSLHAPYRKKHPDPLNPNDHRRCALAHQLSGLRAL